MKVVQLMASSGEGGLEKHLVDLSNGLHEHGISVSVCANPMYKDRFLPGIEFIPFDFSGSRRNPFLLAKLFFKLKSLRADIIHGQANKAGQVLSTLSPFLTSKTVTTVHNIKKHLNYTSSMDLVIGVSNAVSAQIKKNKCITIYNGIKAPLAHKNDSARESPSDLSPTKWLAVGRLVNAKGFDVLIKAFRDVSGILNIAGEGPERSRLEAMIKQYNLSDRVKLLGHRNDIQELMYTADAVVISSRREGFSYVFSEALLSGKPVVSTDVPVPNEILYHNLIAPIEDSKALAQVMRDYKKYYSYHLAAQKFAAHELTLDAMVSKTIDAYRRVLQE